MRQIPGRPPKSKITLMNTFYWKEKQSETSKGIDELLTVVYKDRETGIKHAHEIFEPEYTYYMALPDHRVDYGRLFIESDHAMPITVPYKSLEKDIAKRTGLTEFFYANNANGNRGENRKLHLHPDVFNSDMNIQDNYMLEFSRMYDNEPCSITKAFFDIEVDGINAVGDFPEPGECAINAISLILQEQKQIFAFLLETASNPLIQQFKQEVQNGTIFPELSDFIVQAVGGPEVAAAYNLNGFNFNFMFYKEEDEINLIKDLFAAINAYQPDFALAWNMAFDVPYIIARIERLGYDPREIMCHPDFKNKVAGYFVDEQHKSDFAERGDFARIASYTTYLDQMIHFASRRKGQNKFHSFTLDFIGEAVAKVRKLDYKHITTNIAELPYKDYKTFVFYNIMDTIVQYCIEHNTGDLNYVFNKSNMNCTRYSKTHRQTVYLTNRVTKDIREEGYIIGNNRNKFNPKPTEKFPGAFVADPEQLSDYALIKIAGRAIMCANNADDFDYASLYPSIIREFNIAPNTQIGMLSLSAFEFSQEDYIRANNTVAGAFMEDIQSQVWFEFGCRWFNLADYATLVDDVIDFFTTVMNPFYGLRNYDENGNIDPWVIHNPDLLQSPMDFYDEVLKDSESVVIDKWIEPPKAKWKEFRDNAARDPNQLFSPKYDK